MEDALKANSFHSCFKDCPKKYDRKPDKVLSFVEKMAVAMLDKARHEKSTSNAVMEATSKKVCALDRGIVKSAMDSFILASCEFSLKQTGMFAD